MGVFFGISTGDPLPSDAGLRSGAAQLRAAAQALSDRAASMRTVAATIGPGVWHDSASGRATTFINALADELVTGSSSLEESASALDSLAQYVSGQRFRYGEVLSELATTHHGITADASALVREMGLAEEQRSIEGSVTAAMAHAADTINSAAAAASRYQYSPGHSLWSRITDFLSGVGDGIYGGAKSLVGLAVELAKLSPGRMLVDPQGYFHDLEHLADAVAQTGDTIYHHPMAFLMNAVMYDEFRKDPVHWAGEIIPAIVIGAFTDGAGDAGEAVDLAATAGEATAQSGAVTSRLLSDNALEHIFEGQVRVDGEGNLRSVGFHSVPDGVRPEGNTVDMIGKPDKNGVYQANVAVDYNGIAVDKITFGDPHTMFPDAWDKQTVVQAIEEAFTNGNKIVNGVATGPTELAGSYKWQGTFDGVTIQGYVNNGKMMTAFPKYNW